MTQSSRFTPLRSSAARSAATAFLTLLVLVFAAPAFAQPVTAVWDPNPEPNIAGYLLLYGTQSGVYSTTIDVGNVTSWPLSLSAAEYYFAVQAYDTDGQFGAYSIEVVYTVSNATGPAISSVTPASAPVGATVLIAGSGFGALQGTSTVTFNGATAAVASWSATSLRLSVPSGATTGNVVVTVGAVASNGVMFTVVPPPAGGHPTMAVDRTSLNFGAVNSGTAFTFQTPAQAVNITQTGAQGTVTWTAVSDAPWLTVSPNSGIGPAALSIGVQYVSSLPPAGSPSLTGAVTVRYTGSVTATSVVSTRLNLPGSPAPPSGLIDTPAVGATGLQGSIAVTGWVVDDISVDRVELWRDLQPGETTPPFAGAPSDPRTGKVFIANATLVNDARSDIEALNPTTPLNYRGGWGYLLLTWGLWNQGNGSYALLAVAFDAEGHAATLGQRIIGVANDSADRPFGSIDTPGIGATVSGSVVNFGWGLTPKTNGMACTVLPTGVQVSIDSGPLQPVVFGDVRSDIAAGFAGLTNSAAAGGHFTFDTTALANGVHTIGWLITDDCNRADGVGSRFFSVLNSSAVALPAAAVSAPGANLLVRVESGDPIVVSHGFGELGMTVPPDSTGWRVVSLKQGDRIEVRLPSGYDEVWQLVAGDRRALPSGATWDVASRLLAWQPAPGFLGAYELVFVRDTETIRVRISVF